MKHAKSGVSRLKRIVCALALAGLGSYAGAAELHGLEVRGEGDVLRLLVETQPGTLQNSGLSAEGGMLAIDLKGVDADKLRRVVGSMKESHRLIRQMKVVAVGKEDSRLLVSLREPADVLDETIAAVAADRSRWEIVLGRHATVDELVELELKAADGGLSLNMRGGAQMQAKASIQEKPPALLIDFPRLSRQQLAAVVEQFQPEHPLVKGVELQALKKSGARIVLKLNQPVELAAPEETRNDTSTRMVLALAAGGALGSGHETETALDAIATHESQGRLDIVLSGSKMLDVKVDQLEGPQRLVVELKGVSKRKAQEVASQFQSLHPAILGARLGKASPGSVQIVFDLAQTVKVVGSHPEKSAAGKTKRFVIALDVGGGAAGAVVAAPAEEGTVLDLRVPKESLGPMMLVKPVVLNAWPSTDRDVSGGEALASIGLMQTLDRALEADSKYKAARADFLANAEAVPQAWAGVLPTATYDYQRTNTHQDAQSSTPGSEVTTRSYPVRSSVFTITQPIIKLPAVMKIRQARISENQARVGLVAAEQDLIVRVAGAYLNFLAAQDGVELARAERDATQKQAELAKSRMASGLGTVTQLYETEGRLALTQAREVEAANKLDDARGGLKEIIGADVKGLKPFSGDFDAAPPQPAQAEPWVSAALEQNLSLQSRNLAAEIAALEVRRQQAGYLPTVSLVATKSSSYQGDSLVGGSFYGGSDVKGHDLSVKVNIPIFEGGMTTSLVRESVARQDKALQERDQEYRKTERQARSSLLSVVSSAQTLSALRKSLLAQESALETKQEGLRSGLYSVVQVVDAYRLYYAAKRDYLQARYDYLLNRLKLKQAVGSLARTDLEDLAELLK